MMHMRIRQNSAGDYRWSTSLRVLCSRLRFWENFSLLEDGQVPREVSLSILAVGVLLVVHGIHCKKVDIAPLSSGRGTNAEKEIANRSYQPNWHLVYHCTMVRLDGLFDTAEMARDCICYDQGAVSERTY